MKKHLFLLPCMFGISAVLLTACTGRDNENTVTQEITTTQETLAAGASGSTVSVTEKQNSDTPLPAAGDSVPIADSGIKAAAAAGGGTEGQAAYISEEDAKKIALEHAGLKEEDISYFKMKLDTDHGVTEYEVEFVSGNTEYDYDIDAVTGAIRSFDFETHNGLFRIWRKRRPPGRLHKRSRRQENCAGKGARRHGQQPAHQDGL